MDEKQLPIVYIHSETGSKMDIRNGSVAEVFTDTGSLDCVIEYNDSIRRDILMIYQGWWIQRLGGVNRLISERYSDMGNNAAYYECICNIRYKA